MGAVVDGKMIDDQGKYSEDNVLVDGEVVALLKDAKLECVISAIQL